MKIKITADCTCDLTQDMIKQLNVGIKPVSIIMNDQEYLDGVTITLPKLFEMFKESGQLPRTSACNPVEYEEFFNEQLKSDDGYDALIHFSLSSGISSLNQNAATASKAFDNKVWVIDSQTLSTAIALQIYYAYELIQKGLSPQEIVDKVIARRPYAQASFVIDTLKFLYKGGRCSALSMFGANILGIKPSIIVKDGKMGVGKKFRGKYDKVVLEYVDSILETYTNPDTKRVFITYTTLDNPEIVDKIKEILEEKFDEILVTNAGCTIGSHCGPNTLGILFYTDGKQDEN